MKNIVKDSMEFSQQDEAQIQEHGLSMAQVLGQLEMFRRGFPPTRINTPAVIGNGISNFSADEKKKYIQYFDSHKNKSDIVKFVPASGAATRMFQSLNSLLTHYDPQREKLKDFIAHHRLNNLEEFLNSFSDFAFANHLRKAVREQYPDYKFKTRGERALIVAEVLLSPEGLNFGRLPKGLIPFHKYNKHFTTAFEEQLFEGCFYAANRDEVFVHFTFAPVHVEYFKAAFDGIKNRVQKKTKKEVHVSYSFQKSATDTIAVNSENEPVRDKAGKLVFRPAGHGALLENLNEIDADVVFIKNIDNVIAEEYVEEISSYKKMLGGKLLWLQHKIHHYVKELRQEEIDPELVTEVKSFMWNELNIKDVSNSILHLLSLLNRPTRVCGMVKNTGAPGGGPFWVVDAEGTQSLQIVESAQIDLKDPSQRNVFGESTHFNPVDLVCGVRNYKGDKYDLSAFTDPNTGFITQKDKDGNIVKALELPGLWNGSMAQWNTVFVEVPLITFNPVKAVNDLLQREHRPNM
ncbi:DUF4301 family protein [Gilvibacter sp.]|uniref:DUF4301 family protein n=1 Tax=Gilvibacter sp. TaxID=2729997 RepID=UPI0025B8CB0B|nr:DUF4301 family protein [Gilvibacter sp.]